MGNQTRARQNSTRIISYEPATHVKSNPLSPFPFPVKQKSILWYKGREFHSSRVPRRSEAAVSPTCRSMKYISPSPLRNRCWILSRNGRKKNDEEEDREGPRRLKEKGRRREQREEEKKLGDSSTAFACGKSVGTVRCKVNGPESPGLVCLLTALGRGERWHRTYLLSSFPYAWKRNQDKAPRYMINAG